MADKDEIVEVKREAVTLSYLRLVLLDGHLNHAIVRACEILELALSDEKKSYINKVEVLMSVLEGLLTDCLIRISPETTSLLFDYLLKHTLFLVLHADWGENKAVKLHMESLFRRFRKRAEKKKLGRVVADIDYLLQLMIKGPWDSVPLSDNQENEELLEFVKNELGVFLNVRLEVMIYARCDLQAMTLMEKCLSCIVSPSNNEYFQSFTNEITYLRDLYMLVLNKAKSTEYIRSRIENEVGKRGLEECLGFVKRCQNGQLPFEALSKKSASIVVNIALVLAVTQVDTDDQTFNNVIKLWFEVITSDYALFKLVKHMVDIAVCSRYIYSIGEKLIERVQLREKELCVGVFVRGLTLNMNEIERFETNENPTEVGVHKIRLSNGFLLLADYLKEDVMLHREIVLAAFSLNPTQSVFTRIEALGGNGENPLMERMNIDIDRSKQKERMLLQDGKNQSTISQNDQKLNPDSALPQFTLMDHSDNTPNERSSCDVPWPQQDVHLHDSTLKGDSENNLLQQVSSLSLECEVCSISGCDKENNPENESKVPRNKRLESLQVFDSKVIGISQTLCDDLSALVSSVKNRYLSWDLGWRDVIQRCLCIMQGNDSDWNIFQRDQSNQEDTSYASIHSFLPKVEISKKSSKKKRKRV